MSRKYPAGEHDTRFGCRLRARGISNWRPTECWEAKSSITSPIRQRLHAAGARTAGFRADNFARGPFILIERLQKLIAQAGIASRRAAEDMIVAGEVSVNGQIVTALGTKADPEKDHIKVRGKLINTKLRNRPNIYILLNKPKGYLSSAADPEGRKLVTDLVKGYGKLHPVGRLDYNTEGLIVLTNDGKFTNLVASSKSIPKVYEVKVKGLPTEVAIRKLRRGVVLEDGYKTAPAEIKELKPTDKNGW